MATSEQAPSSRSQRTSPLAIAALVCGIVGIWLLPAGIVAIMLSRKAQRQIQQNGDNGYGMAKAAALLGCIGIALAIVGLVVPLLIGLATSVTARP